MGIARAAQGTRQHHREGERNLEHRHDLQKHRAQLDDRFVGGEGAKKRIGKKEEDQTHGRHDERRHAVGFPVFKLRPRIFARADTLAHHRGGGNCEPVPGQKRQGFDREADLVGGVGNGAVQQNDLGVDQDARLLDDPLA